MSIKDQIDAFEYWGYNPIHIVGNWYLVRFKSTKYAKYSWYYLKKFYETPLTAQNECGIVYTQQMKRWR